ncbi:asparaginase [Pseudorhodobacter turbinis]|uniref:Asparaginase n=1 Tax=Pseudorhodobacter turbinis TaxID=2500533 RepID=A0A4P8EHT5_9RHOB|nr:asparaginase [Pseudorhodobacter turbinis]QCO56145.1 asparaginase [Pseudorhodobacter turbinis]
MADSAAIAELWRGGQLESTHFGHAVICGADGSVEAAWGDPDAVIFPRSSCKMVQALPLMESGAGRDLTSRQLGLVCASHNGAALHTEAVAAWLKDMGLGESDLRCGNQTPQDKAERDRLIKTDSSPCQLHNNCSGKHAGFLMLNKHLGGHADYVEVDHPVQMAIKAAHEELTGEQSAGYGIDGCSAPNYSTSVAGLARAMAYFATAREDGDARQNAAYRLSRGMMAYPEMVAGEGRACTELMRAMGGKVAIKTGAEAVFVGIIPELQKGIALKVMDGGTRGAELAITALLVKLGVLDADHPAARKRLNTIERNWRGFETGSLRLAPGFGEGA